jgi:hypothetical protein
MASHVEFVAVLVFQKDEWRVVEPYVYTATHPEIAYQLALAEGREERPGQFLGLAELEVKTEKVLPIGEMRQGDGKELVLPRNELSAFQDYRWIGVPCDRKELQAALREPPLLVELDGLDEIEWDRLSHAYGPARDVPLDLQRLASSDRRIRDRAFSRLDGSIYHQGSIYEATAAAVPFLVRLASDPALPNRSKILKLLAWIAASTPVDEDRILKAFAELAEWYQRFSGRPAEQWSPEKARAEINIRRAVLEALRRERPALAKMLSHRKSKISTAAASVLKEIGEPES